MSCCIFQCLNVIWSLADEAWLRLLNTERRKESLGSVSTDLFENIMDQIEKEWFDLVRILNLRIHNRDRFDMNKVNMLIAES
jgi:hypothetical protein